MSNDRNFREEILDQLSDGSIMSLKKMSHSLAVPQEDLTETLAELVEEGEIMRSRSGNYAFPSALGCAVGRLEIKRRGFGFVRQTDGDIFVSANKLNGAYDGETVIVRITRRGTKEGSREGEVICILSKEPYRTTGTFIKERSSAFVAPDDMRTRDIFIPKGCAGNAKNGQKVVIELTKRQTGDRSAEAKVVEVLGDEGAPGVDILTIARRFGMNKKFPKAVEAQLEKTDLSISQEELAYREDLTNEIIFTIDGADSKDLDDAVSVKRVGSGWQLGVHIADVSHYVRPRTPLDKEAYKRGTSVYLVDQVIPMLPEELSNGICSLNPEEVRLTLSCFMDIDETAKITSHRLAKTYIRSKHKMTYGDVNAILEDEDQELRAKYADITPTLEMMRELAARLREVRFKHGSIDFEIDEAKIELDEDGKPIHIGLRERRTAEKLIEEFMLAANNTVAAQFAYMETPFMYRIHELPDDEKMDELRTFLMNFGYRLKGKEIHSRTLQDILNQASGTEHEAMISRVMLRSLKKARYSEVNAGHFGLASPAYCHFTSPIRRYPDLVVHRVVKDFLDGKLTDAYMRELEKFIPAAADASSAAERIAIDAERKIVDMKKAEYLANHLGEEYDGVVSGIANTAVFVELPNTAEGVIPLDSLNDYFVVFREMYCVIGKRTGIKIALGDKVRIRVADADPKNARVEFALLSVGDAFAGKKAIHVKPQSRTSGAAKKKARRKRPSER